MRFSIYCEERKDYLIPSEILEINEADMIVKLKILDEKDYFNKQFINKKIVFGFPNSNAWGKLIAYIS